LIELEPKNERNYYKRFRAFLSERKYPQALNDLSSALEINPKYKQALLQRGKLNMMLGQCKEATKDFEQMLQHFPQDNASKENYQKSNECTLYLNEAEKAQMRGDYQTAHAYLTKVIEETAVSSITLLLERAQLGISLMQPYDAIADLGTVLKLDSSSIPALQMRGQVLYSLGDRSSMESALSHYRTGLHSDPEHSGIKKLYRQLKKLLKYMDNAEKEMASGQFYEAIESLEAAIHIDPNHGQMTKDLFFKLCQCQIKQKDYSKAQIACETALSSDQNFAAAYAKLGEALIALEKFEEAVRACQKAVELDENNREYRETLQRAEAALQQSKNKNYYKILGKYCSMIIVKLNSTN
jgi:DnaJ family protein C protein 3